LYFTKATGIISSSGSKDSIGFVRPCPLFRNEPTSGMFERDEQKISFYTSSFLPPALRMTEFSHKNFSLLVSSPARAMMKCLYLMPKEISLYECYELMEGLNNLVPNQVQQLLENCTSVKVKRLFLYLAEKSDHEWVKFLNKEKIDLGKGKRSFAKKGLYIPQYQITVSKDLEDYELPEV